MLSESNKIRADNSLRLAFVALVVVAGSFYFKVPANVLVVKLLVIPMFWLSLLGLKALYKNPIEEQPVFSANVIEYNILYVILFGTLMLIICWTPEVELMQIVKGAVSGILVALPLSLYLHHRAQRIDAV